MACESAQAAWVRGWGRLGQLRDETLVLTWVNTIALNVYRRLIREAPLFRSGHALTASRHWNIDWQKMAGFGTGKFRCITTNLNDLLGFRNQRMVQVSAT